MMDASTSISTLLSPPLSLSPSSNLNFVQLDDNSYVEGATYCIYDPSCMSSGSSTYQIVLQGDGADQAMAFAFVDEQGQTTTAEDINNFSLVVEPTKAIFQVANNDQDSIHVKTEQLPAAEYVIALAQGTPEGSTQQQQQSDPLSTTLPTFYSDMAIALSNDSETHETYLPLSFDEASHFLFHGREECVITTDIPIPTVEPSFLSSSSTSNNSFDSDISNAGRPARKRSSSKPKVPTRPRINEGLMINKKVYKCPNSDCPFWAARGHRFHEHMCTHDAVRPFRCSQCTYETNWKSDVKKHIARMIERNSKDHESAVLIRISDKIVDTNRYKEYLINLDVPCNMYSGRVGQPSRSNISTKKAKKEDKPLRTIETHHTYNDSFSSNQSTATSNSSTADVPPTKKSRHTKPKKTKNDCQPIIMVTQTVESEQNVFTVAPLGPPPEIHLPPLPEAECKPVVVSSEPSNTFAATQEMVEVEATSDITSEDVTNIKIEVAEEQAAQAEGTTITTNDGITIKIIPAERPAPIKPKKKSSSPRLTTSKPKHKTSKKSNSENGNTKSHQMWRCTNCDFTHSDRFNTLNHMSRFHKLRGTAAKPTLTTSPSIPAAKRSAKVNANSQPSQGVIVRKLDDGCGNFQQYFLVVENGTKQETSTRNDLQPEMLKLNFKCDKCPFIAEDGYGLMRHQGFHGKLDESLTYTCPHCNFKSATRKDMEQHKQLHTQSSGKQMKLNDYSRINLKRSENGRSDSSASISKPQTE